MFRQFVDKRLLTQFRVMELHMLAPYSCKRFLAGHSLSDELRQSLGRLRQLGI